MNKSLMLISRMSTHLMEVHDTLRRSNITVIHIEDTYDVKAGLEMHSPAFVLLDFDIKGADYLLGNIVSESYTPQPYIMIAMAYADGNDRAAMLKRGADHCVDKPINAHEVLAVINSVLRRRGRQAHIFRYKDMVIHKSHRTVTMRGEPVSLTRKEYQVLCFLTNHVGMILTKEEIYRAVWKTDHDPKNTNVSDQISSLRNKLRLNSKSGDYISTVIGVGYRFGTVGK